MSRIKLTHWVEIAVNRKGKYFWRLVTHNGRTLIVSDGRSSKQATLNSLTSVTLGFKGVQPLIKDLTVKQKPAKKSAKKTAKKTVKKKAKKKAS